MLRVVRCVRHVACCKLPPGAHALEAGQCQTSGRWMKFRWSRRAVLTMYGSACSQLAQIAVAGTTAEMALLAGLTEKNLDASYIELLRLFRVRHSVADGHL